MSEFLAEARILVRPDTTRFRAQLQEEVNRAISQTRVPPIAVPLSIGTAGVAAAAAATGALATAQEATTASTLGLASAAQVENTAFGRQAVILQAATAATAEKAGADAVATAAARAHAATMGQVEKAAFASAAGMAGLRGAVLTAGTAFLGATVAFQAFGQSVSLAVDLERQLNVFRVTAGATADEMERVAATARALGRDITLPGVAAQDAAAAMTQLSRAGLSVQDSLDAARGTLQLATAAQIDNAQAAELVANSLNAFRLEGTEATRVADLLAGAANASQGSISDMGLALRQVAAVANLVGLSVEETVTLLTQLSRAGLSASDAGTSLRTTLLRLIGDFPKVAAEVERLGLDLRDMTGAIRPEFFAELGQRLQRMAPQARQATIALLGGSDAIRAIGILSRSSIQDLQNLESQITQAGIAQEVASAQTAGLGGDVEAAKNEFADLGTTVGQVASGPLSLLVRTAGSAAGAINDVAAATREADQGFFETFNQTISDFAGSFERLNFSFRTGVRAALDASDGFVILDRAARSTTTTINALADALERASKATLSRQGIPAEGLNVQQVLNRLAGFDAEEVRARISGDTAELVAVLESERAFLEQQLQRQFVLNRPGLRRQLENALLGVTNDLRAVSDSAAAETKRVAAEVARVQKEADQALLDALSNRRQDAERRAAAAAQTEGLNDDIRAQDRIQALIKVQIQKVRAQIKDEEARRNAIRELRIALIASRREEDALRQQRAQDRTAARQEGIELDIEFAEITGNVAREIAARQRLIALLKKQQASVKKGTAEWKRLRNEIAEQQQAIKDARGEAEKGDEEGNRAAEFFFQQLQAQQGFAANLLGNIIPKDATAGLVGVPSPAAVTIGGQVSAEAKAARGTATGGPSAGQVSTTNDILLRIERLLFNLNRGADNPEALYQRKMTSAALTGGGGNVEVM